MSNTKESASQVRRRLRREQAESYTTVEPSFPWERKSIRRKPEAYRAAAQRGYKALTTRAGLYALFPTSREEHGFKQPAGKRASRVILNRGMKIYAKDKKALERQRAKSIKGMKK